MTKLVICILVEQEELTFLIHAYRMEFSFLVIAFYTVLFSHQSLFFISFYFLAKYKQLKEYK